MEHFSEEHSKLLLSKEWLVKTDNQASTPYLLKFYSSTVDLSSYVMLTDTKSVWAEVLTSNQFARRWRDCNDGSPSLYADAADEDAWRTTTLELLSRAHTLGGVADLSFEVTPSSYADFSFRLDGENFKWKWEACFVGHRLSAEIISKHLIFPLISTNHLAFSSRDILSELPDNDVEKAVDKVGRTARRTVDTHIKNAISKPRVATTLRRMTAVFNFISDLPPVISTAEKPDLRPEVITSKGETRSSPIIKHHSISPRSSSDALVDAKLVSRERGSSLNPLNHTDSATESDVDQPVPPDEGPTSKYPSSQTLPSTSKPLLVDDANQSSDSSPARPTKKLKKPDIISSDDDSEEERKRRITQLKGGTGPGGTKRGTRQPIMRGGKRF